MQIYKCIKVKYLNDRPSPVTSLGTVVSRCQHVWFAEMQWERAPAAMDLDEAPGPSVQTVASDSGGGGDWQLMECKVAPQIPSEPVFPDGQLVARLDVQKLEDRKNHCGIRDFMLWANDDNPKPPQGFRYLCRWVDTLARNHKQPITPLTLQVDGSAEPPLPLDSCSVVAVGHRSLVLRLSPDVQQVIKVSSTANITRERQLHVMADGANCPYLRKAVPGQFGVVLGAGEGLSWLALDKFCERTIEARDVIGAEKFATVWEQVRCSNACYYCHHICLHLRLQALL